MARTESSGFLDSKVVFHGEFFIADASSPSSRDEPLFLTLAWLPTNQLPSYPENPNAVQAYRKSGDRDMDAGQWLGQPRGGGLHKDHGERI